MKILIFLLLIIEINVCSQTNYDLYYRIAPVYNFKESIISLTFDDGTPIQFDKAVPMLNERNIQATFYIPTYTLSDSSFRNAVYNAYLSHHEIGSHTINHYNLTTIGTTSAEFEISQAQKDINALCGKKYCTTFAYPFGSFNDSVVQITKKYYLAARSVLGGYNSILSFNRYELKEMSFIEPTAALLNKRVERAVNNKVWLIELFHGMDGIGNYPIKSTEFKNHLDFIKTYESIMWFATVANVIKYYDECKNARLICDECNENRYKLRLEDNLDDSVYNQPLSLKTRIPDSWNDIQVNGAEFNKTLCIDGNQFLLFNALPNNQLITIIPQTIGVLKSQPAIRFLSIDPNPFGDHLEISFEVQKFPFELQVDITTMNGKVVYNGKVSWSEPIINYRINTSKFPEGIYVIKIDVNNYSDNQILVRKIIKF
jgi:peptidoglycan/xylan/chitin deacetylase (PgdA/CDA1 family)